jgi:acyl-CoA synthetase (NDP forming)
VPEKPQPPSFVVKDTLTHGVSVAVYGLSRKGQGFAWSIFRHMARTFTGIQWHAVHPEEPRFANIPCTATAKGLRPTPDIAIIVLRGKAAIQAMNDAAEAGTKRVWLPMTGSREALAEAERLGLLVRTDCPLCHTPKAGFPHTTHRWLMRVFKTWRD